MNLINLILEIWNQCTSRIWSLKVPYYSAFLLDISLIWYHRRKEVTSIIRSMQNSSLSHSWVQVLSFPYNLPSPNNISLNMIWCIVFFFLETHIIEAYSWNFRSSLMYFHRLEKHKYEMKNSYIERQPIPTFFLKGLHLYQMFLLSHFTCSMHDSIEQYNFQYTLHKRTFPLPPFTLLFIKLNYCFSFKWNPY